MTRGMLAVDAVARQVAQQVDRLLGKGWNRRDGKFMQPEPDEEAQPEGMATCSCGSGIPIQKITVHGQEMTLVALPLIFQNFRDAHKSPSRPVLDEMMAMVKIYNRIQPADEPAVRQEIEREYQVYWHKQEASRD